MAFCLTVSDSRLQGLRFSPPRYVAGPFRFAFQYGTTRSTPREGVPTSPSFTGREKRPILRYLKAIHSAKLGQSLPSPWTEIFELVIIREVGSQTKGSMKMSHYSGEQIVSMLRKATT